jgi:hypothetical protein
VIHKIRATMLCQLTSMMLGVLILTACGGTSDSADDTDATTTAANTTTAATATNTTTPTTATTATTPATPATPATATTASGGTVEISASSYTVEQSARTLTVSVTRSGGSSGAISVAYATSSGTAVAGTDYAASSGTLNWADGDASAKIFSVAISNATPFSGTKSFSVALSGPAGGATIGSPGSASVTITGTAAMGSGYPGAPGNFLMTNQGQDDVVFTWNAATAGSYPIAYYRIYRNGSAYDTTTALTYTDSDAINITTPGYNPLPYFPATVYRYTVSAVDTQGHEGPQQTQCIAWVYHDGVDAWSTATNSYNSPGMTEVDNDTTAPLQTGSPADIKITMPAGSDYWQPFPVNRS